MQPGLLCGLMTVLVSLQCGFCADTMVGITIMKRDAEGKYVPDEPASEAFVTDFCKTTQPYLIKGVWNKNKEDKPKNTSDYIKLTGEMKEFFEEKNPVFKLTFPENVKHPEAEHLRRKHTITEELIDGKNFWRMISIPFEQVDLRIMKEGRNKEYVTNVEVSADFAKASPKVKLELMKAVMDKNTDLEAKYTPDYIRLSGPMKEFLIEQETVLCFPPDEKNPNALRLIRVGKLEDLKKTDVPWTMTFTEFVQVKVTIKEGGETQSRFDVESKVMQPEFVKGIVDKKYPENDTPDYVVLTKAMKELLKEKTMFSLAFLGKENDTEGKYTRQVYELEEIKDKRDSLKMTFITNIPVRIHIMSEPGIVEDVKQTAEMTALLENEKPIFVRSYPHPNYPNCIQHSKSLSEFFKPGTKIIYEYLEGHRVHIDQLHVKVVTDITEEVGKWKMTCATYGKKIKIDGIKPFEGYEGDAPIEPVTALQLEGNSQIQLPKLPKLQTVFKKGTEFHYSFVEGSAGAKDTGGTNSKESSGLSEEYILTYTSCNTK